jgi:predicted phage terminase large subunit-like protein
LSRLAQTIIDAARKALAQRYLLDFITYTKPDYKVNWHHRVICGELDALITGETTRLILCTPPRHGKSEIASRRFPAYIFGKDPDAEIIACSYTSDLAQRMNRDVQRIIDSPQYRAVFPDVRLWGTNIRTTAQGSYLRNSDIFEIVGHRGSYRSAGTGGAITGMGAEYAIIDDPVKNREDASSETLRKKLWEWYASTLYTRLTPDGRVLLILTRWHEDDLAGRLIEQMKSEDGERWRVISLPALAESGRGDAHESDGREEGEALWPGAYGIKRLRTIKGVIGSYEWSALYQQRPAPEEGAIFLRHWWRYYDESPAAAAIGMDEIIQSWDMSFKDAKDSDYVAGQVWGKKGADRFLLDQIRERMDFPTTIKAVCALKSKWPQTGRIFIEDTANGPAVISTLQSVIQGLIPVKPEGGKAVRAHAISAQIESGNVYIPALARSPWAGDFIEECSSFPNGAHDDQVDAMSQALIHMTENDPMDTWRKLGIVI